MLLTDFGPVCDFWQSSSSTWQVLDPTGQLEACCVWWTVFNLPISACSLSPFHTSLNFFWGATLGPWGTCPGYPALSVGLITGTQILVILLWYYGNIIMDGDMCSVMHWTYQRDMLTLAHWTNPIKYTELAKIKTHIDMLCNKKRINDDKLHQMMKWRYNYIKLYKGVLQQMSNVCIPR